MGCISSSEESNAALLQVCLDFKLGADTVGVEESEDTHHHHIYQDQDKYKNPPNRPQDAPPKG
jgi:hypothetical protein